MGKAPIRVGEKKGGKCDRVQRKETGDASSDPGRSHFNNLAIFAALDFPAQYRGTKTKPCKRTPCRKVSRSKNYIGHKLSNIHIAPPHAARPLLPTATPGLLMLPAADTHLPPMMLVRHSAK